MPVFLVERNFAEQLQVTPEGAASINKVNAEIGVQWLISFLSVDKKKTYCLYEASAEAIRAAAVRNGVPADSIIEVGELTPGGDRRDPEGPLRERLRAAGRADLRLVESKPVRLVRLSVQADSVSLELRPGEHHDDLW